LNAEPGTFRTQEYQNPTSAVLLLGVGRGIGSGQGGGIGRGAAVGGLPIGPEADRLEQFSDLQDADSKEKKDVTKALLENFRAKSTGGKVTGILPVNVSFPAFGPSIFLVSELTSENQFQAAEFSFQRDKKGGVR
jgi:hypothetical protein